MTPHLNRKAAGSYGIYGDHDRVAIGIHTTGTDAENSGRRIDAYVYDFLFSLAALAAPVTRNPAGQF
jgi:hypothetical protein